MLSTQHLILVPLTHEQVKLYKYDQQALAKNLGINYLEPQHAPEIVGELREAIEFWIEGTRENSDDFMWYTTWVIILKQSRVIIGGIGFAGKPDSDGKSMVGYGLDVRYHGHGYATEALEALKSWAFLQPSVLALVADTPLDNIPSHRVLEKNGFIRTGENAELIHWRIDR